MAKFVRDTYSAFHLAEEITFAPISGVEHLFAGLEDPLSSPPTSLPPSDSSQGRRGTRSPLFQPDPLVDPPPLIRPPAPSLSSPPRPRPRTYPALNPFPNLGLTETAGQKFDFQSLSIGAYICISWELAYADARLTLTHAPGTFDLSLPTPSSNAG